MDEVTELLNEEKETGEGPRPFFFSLKWGGEISPKAEDKWLCKGYDAKMVGRHTKSG